MQKIFETDRLVIRSFTSQDAQFIIKLVNTQGWLKFIGDRNIHNVNDALIYINKLNDYYKKNGFGFWAVELKLNKNVIGLCGLIKRDELKCIDIGFAFLPIYTNQGYAFEAANATMNFAKEKLQLDKISAITVAENLSSIKLIEKLGLSFINEITMENEQLLYFEKSY